jgi:hypothetical protein
MSQLHKRFTDDQVKLLLNGYCQGLPGSGEIQEMLGIGKTRFFSLLKEYRRDPEAFSVAYERPTCQPLLSEKSSGSYLSSVVGNAERTLEATRTHWQIANGLHWVLDIAFREDECRIRNEHGAQNFAILRHIATNLLKQEKTAKMAVKAKRLRAGWDEDYLLTVLSSLFE